MTLRRFVLDAEVERERVDKVLARVCDDVSRATLQRWISEGRVRLDGKPCRPSDRVRAGAVIELEMGAPLPTAAAADPSVVFELVHEDEDLVVVDKPAGLVVHPSKGHWEGTLVNGLLARSSLGGADVRDPMSALRPGVVHRLDKDTSGLLVIAKNEAAREHLKLQIQRRTVERRYRALTVGVPREQVIRSSYGRDPRSRLRFTSRLTEGKLAVTHVAVVSTHARGRAALVECRLETGRTHQIRVHLLEQAKTPLIGDRLYRAGALPPELAAIADALGRQALHAAVLGFVHPRTGAALRFESALPEDMRQALAALTALDA